ncbi:MAG: Glu-tRNA(Gln) amidotransferase subunit GatD [Candidatus Thorarchaeota archaeon]
MSLDDSGYTGICLKGLIDAGVKIGDTIKIIQNGQEYTGVLMPRAQVGSDPDHVVIKLDTGFNIGVKMNSKSQVRKISSAKKRKKQVETQSEKRVNLPTVAVLSTGGTIASKVDYRTGAVNPALSAQDLYDAVPELKNHANIDAKVVMSVFSEDIKPSDWTKIARNVASKIKAGVDGVVIAHGTDTLAFTSAALSFALQNLPVPVVLVGSQRSSDRPSSDAAVNLIGAVDLVGKVDAAEVMIAMHAETDDSFLYAHRGTRTRKNHTSRRDAFQSINSYPLYKIKESEITELSPPLFRRNPERKLKLKPKFEEKVALVKTYPGVSESIIDHLVNNEYRGIVIEGTGLGHAPISLQSSLKNAVANGIIVAMTSQCISGRVDMNVYRTGVELVQLGVIPCEDMIAETALAKLMWLLANTTDLDKVRGAMTDSIVGEIDMRTEQSQYTSFPESQ